jgi:hypothetical protein
MVLAYFYTSNDVFKQNVFYTKNDAFKLQHGHGGVHWSYIVHLYVFDAEFQSDKSTFHY